MKRFFSSRARSITTFGFFAFTLILFTVLTDAGAELFTRWHGVVIGICITLLAIPAHFVGSKIHAMYVVSIVMNSVAMGFMASAYYSTKGVPSDARDLIPAILLPIILMLICCIILTVLPSAKHPVIAVFGILELGFIIASIVFWCIRGGEFYAFSFFSFVIMSFYTVVLAFTADEEERELLRDISFGGFGAFFIIALVVIAIISEGDACDCSGCDCGDCGGGKKKK